MHTSTQAPINTSDALNPAKQDVPANADVCIRKVARSGHISYDGRPFFISKTLAGHYIRLIIFGERMIIDTAIPLHKEFSLNR